MKEKESKELVLNGKGVLFITIIILSLTFALGVITGNKEGEDVTIFTSDDLNRIVELQKYEDEKQSGATIYACKDKKGNLMIGYEYNSKRK